MGNGGTARPCGDLELCQAPARTAEQWVSIPFTWLLSMLPTSPASLMLHLCEEPGCHGLELWNNSLKEVSSWGWEQED